MVYINSDQHERQLNSKKKWEREKKANNIRSLIELYVEREKKNTSKTPDNVNKVSTLSIFSSH